MSIISGNMIGTYSQIGKTFTIVDENGVELIGVITDKERILTADAAKDIREGTVAVTEEGIVTGSKVIPSYETTKASYGIFPGEFFSIPLLERDRYDYTQFQCIIAKFNTALTDSVETDRIAINDGVYAVNSKTAVSAITKNSTSKSIDLNIVNNTDDIYVVHYFTYKQEE